MKRKTPSQDLKRKLQQEAQSGCAFCKNSDTTTWQNHHIDGNPENTIYENLIMVCSNCHSKITHGEISESDVVFKKRQLSWELKQKETDFSKISNSLVGSNNVVSDSFNTKVEIKVPGKNYKIQHPQNSIGASSELRGYIDYLIDKLVDAQNKSGIKASHQKVHTQIQREFGCKTFFLNIDRADSIISFIQRKIDRTRLVRGLKKQNRDFYHSFDIHREIMLNGKSKLSSK